MAATGEMKRLPTIFLLLACAVGFSRAQMPPQISPGAAAQLIMRPQPPVDNSRLENVTATAEFDPPVVRPGEKTFYRVTITATQNSIEWPDQITAPAELKFGPSVRGQLMQPDGMPFQPHTEFVYEVTAAAAGNLTVSNFFVPVGGRSVEIPAASLDVDSSAVSQPPRMLLLEASTTNLFFGQPFRVRVILPAAQGNQIEALHDVQFNDRGFLTDKLDTRQSVEVGNFDGQLKPAFVYETAVTPLAAGTFTLSAQAFTAGSDFAGPVTLQGQVTIPNGPTKYVLLISEPLEINVRPLPVEGELPGFTGAIGRFFRDPPQLTTNRLRVGEPVRLKIVFHGEGDLARLVPPAAPRSRDWQIIADPPPATGFTLIPLTDETHETPAIPFSCFDPATGKYADLTISSLPVTVLGEGLPVQLPASDDEGQVATPLKLSALVPRPGKTAGSLKPPQLRGWFVSSQLMPVLGFLGLWQWDRRRRFLAAHPEIVRRRRALRALRHEKKKLQKAVAAGDAAAFIRHAADAMRIAVAPHYPANPRALVCGDVLQHLDAGKCCGQAAATVRKIFAAADAQYAGSARTESDWTALESDVEKVLLKLEAKL